MKSYSKEFRKAALPLFMSNWIFGMGIIEYPLGRPRRILSYVYITSVLTLYTSATIFSLPYLKEFGLRMSANQIIVKTYFFHHIFLTLSSILLGWQRNEGMHLILERVLAADESLQQIGIEKNYRKVFKSQLRKVLMYLLMICIAVSTVIFSLLHNEAVTFEKITFSVVLTFPIIVLTIVDASFFNALQYSSFKFKKLNDLLKDKLTSTCYSPQHLNILKCYEVNLGTPQNLRRHTFPTYIIKDETYTISMARKGHLNFTIFCETVNKDYAIHVFFSMLVAIIALIVCFYHSYAVLISENVKIRYYYIIPILSSMAIYNAIRIYLFTKYCNDVTQESIATGDIISEIYDENINEESKNEIRKFEVQLIERPLKINMFHTAVDYSLIGKIIQTITTYLVILTQCGNVTLEIPEK